MLTPRVLKKREEFFLAGGGCFKESNPQFTDLFICSIYIFSNGILAKDKRLQFHQKGRSMNSTGSGKSSATVSR